MDPKVTRTAEIATALSRPESRDALKDILQRTREDGILARVEVYEILLQSYLFAGFPAGLEAVRALGKVWPEVSDAPELRAERETMSYTLFLERGLELYRRIYSRNAETVRREMLRLSPELAAWAVIEGYGKTLSRPGLDVRLREIAVVAMLTQLGWDRQLFSHIMGALNVGSMQEEVAEAIAVGADSEREKQARGLELLQRALVSSPSTDSTN